MYNNDHCLLAGKPKGNGDCSACIICRLNVVMSKTISNGVFHHISIIPIISFINSLIITLRSSLHIDPPNQQHQWPTRSTSLSQWPQEQVHLDFTTPDQTRPDQHNRHPYHNDHRIKYTLTLSWWTSSVIIFNHQSPSHPDQVHTRARRWHLRMSSVNLYWLHTATGWYTFD